MHLGMFSKGNGVSPVRTGRVYGVQHRFILVVAVVGEARSVAFFVRMSVSVCVCACLFAMLLNIIKCASI